MPPMGVCAILGDQSGDFEWTRRLSLVGDAIGHDCGYPSSVILKDGRVLTVYYATGSVEYPEWGVHCVAIAYRPPSPDVDPGSRNDTSPSHSPPRHLAVPYERMSRKLHVRTVFKARSGLGVSIPLPGSLVGLGALITGLTVVGCRQHGARNARMRLATAVTALLLFAAAVSVYLGTRPNFTSRHLAVLFSFLLLSTMVSTVFFTTWLRTAGVSRGAAYLAACGLFGLSMAAIVSRPYFLARFARGASVDLSGADLRGANLAHASFPGSNLEGADLRKAHFYESFLSLSCLDSANLRDTDLTGAYLANCTLRHADLRGANLSRIPLFDIADFTGARGDRRTRWPACFDSTEWEVVIDP
jgi:uncharacterized protein YjbI with pentapeptide repeats